MSTHQPVTASDLIRNASSVAIETQFRVVAKRMRRWKRWLTSSHRYNGDVVQTLSTDVQQGNIDGFKLAEYIASSVPLHLTDGWNYLSRAFDSASRGDRGSAYHPAYYAELRAAMSLFAAEGIGIFHNHHIALDQHFQPTVYGGNTHEAAWKVLSSWSSEPGKAGQLLQSIKIDSRSLSDWLQSIGVGTPGQTLVAREWLNAWSIDLDIYNDDHARRNEASYRPTRIRVPTPQPVNARQELSGPLFDSWSELDPEVVGGSAALDLALLGKALNLVVDRGMCNFDSVDSALGFLEQQMNPSTIEALRNERPSATAIFQAATIIELQGRPATPILARALLMLRLASARAAHLLAAAEVSKADLKFWWLPWGTDLGLWDDLEDDDFLNLWSDVSAAWEEADELISALPPESSVRTVSDILSRDMTLTQFSRAPLWLLRLE